MGRRRLFSQPMTPAERMRRHRAFKRFVASKGKAGEWPIGRWRASANDCTYDPETEPAWEVMPNSELRRNAAVNQDAEAKRLATDYALLQRATAREEITHTRITHVEAIARAWATLARKLKRRRGDAAGDKTRGRD